MTASAAMLGLWCGVYVLLVGGVLDACDAGSRMRLRYGQTDALFIARCEARCWYSHNKSSCVKTCLVKGFEKPGDCPENGTTLSPFVAVCVDACSQDSQCPALTKCCRHNCGITCQQPENLLTAVEVPNIPRDVKVTEGNKKRTIYIAWRTSPESAPPGSVLYLIEERHHAGRNFMEDRLSEWSACARSAKSFNVLKNFVKPGRWYQFRVAAINENGTKGFSESSPTFSVSISPKPPKPPQNMTVGPLWTTNGTLSTELRWAPPVSDLPIQRYKVFWSKRLHGAKALDSVLVHQQAVSKDQNKFLLENLQPNSLYFLQVQALVQFGKDRLKGEKSGFVLNTTTNTNLSDSYGATRSVPTNNLLSPKSSKSGRIEGLHVQKLYWSQGDLRARIAWKPNRGPLRYTVHQLTGPCQKNFKSYNHLKLETTTKESHFDLFDLQFSCRYRFSVREVSAEGMKSVHDTSVTFTTPSCEDFKLNSRKVRCIH